MQNFSNKGSNPHLLCGRVESEPLDYQGSPMICFIKKDQAWRLDKAFLGAPVLLCPFSLKVLEDETRKSSSSLGLLISTNHASFLQQHRRPHPPHILLHKARDHLKISGAFL